MTIELINRRLIVLVERVLGQGDGGTEQKRKRKKAHGHRQQCDDCEGMVNDERLRRGCRDK